LAINPAISSQIRQSVFAVYWQAQSSDSPEKLMLNTQHLIPNANCFHLFPLKNRGFFQYTGCNSLRRQNSLYTYMQLS
jgi:hypothetical protein